MGDPNGPLIRLQVQQADICIEEEERALRTAGTTIGAVATFSGFVRADQGVDADYRLCLEHYPGMTEKTLAEIIEQSAGRWPLLAVTVIHRVGELRTAERIVFVGVASAHRADAFEACAFIMDFLKTQAPFWKKEISSQGECWVEAAERDQDAAARWQGE